MTGLGSPDPATVLDNRGDEAVFTDGGGADIAGFLLGLPYFVPTMQRATPGILTVPSSS